MPNQLSIKDLIWCALDFPISLLVLSCHFPSSFMHKSAPGHTYSQLLPNNYLTQSHFIAHFSLSSFIYQKEASYYYNLLVDNSTLPNMPHSRQAKYPFES